MSNLTSKAWWAAAGTRAIKTAAQAAIGAIGASAAVIGQVNWQVVAGAAALAAVVSLLTSLEGLPEVDAGATAAAAPVVATESTTATDATAAPVVATESTTATDATTTGVSDSAQALTYTSPKPTDGAVATKAYAPMPESKE